MSEMRNHVFQLSTLKKKATSGVDNLQQQPPTAPLPNTKAVYR